MVSIDFLPAIGGIAGHIANLSRALCEAGHDVTVVRPLRGTGEDIMAAEYDGVPTLDAAFAPSSHRSVEVLRRTRVTRVAIARASARMGGVDIVHQHDFMASALACRSVGWPYVFTNHSSHFLQTTQSLPGRIQARAWQAGMRHIIAPSPELADRSKSIWPSTPVTYIPNGVDVRRFAPTATSTAARTSILCPRRMDPKNGVVFLVEAFLEFRRRFPSLDVELLLTGEAEHPEHVAYEKKIRELTKHEQGDAVKFLGNVPPSQMPDLYRRADIVCIPSLIEAVSLSALEAMATGLPLIASEVGGLPEVVIQDQTGLLVPPRDVEALVRSIHRLVTEPRLRDSLGTNALAFVKSRYTWQHVAQETFNVYLDHRGAARRAF